MSSIINYPVVGKTTRKTTIKEIIDAINALYSSVGSYSTTIPNGSFEQTSDDIPSNWTPTALNNGSYGVSTTQYTDGNHSIYGTTVGGSGNGGATYVSDKFSIFGKTTYYIGFDLYCTSASMGMKIEALCYDSSDNSLGSVTIYSNSSSNPTSWTRKYASFELLSGTKKISIRLTIGILDGGSGTGYFDNIKFVDEVPDYYFLNQTMNLPAGGSVGGSYQSVFNNLVSSHGSNYGIFSINSSGTIYIGMKGTYEIIIKFSDISSYITNIRIYDGSNSLYSTKISGSFVFVSNFSTSKNLYVQATNIAPFGTANITTSMTIKRIGA